MRVKLMLTIVLFVIAFPFSAMPSLQDTINELDKIWSNEENSQSHSVSEDLKELLKSQNSPGSCNHDDSFIDIVGGERIMCCPACGEKHYVEKGEMLERFGKLDEKIFQKLKISGDANHAKSSSRTADENMEVNQGQFVNVKKRKSVLSPPQPDQSKASIIKKQKIGCNPDQGEAINIKPPTIQWDTETHFGFNLFNDFDFKAPIIQGTLDTPFDSNLFNNFDFKPPIIQKDIIPPLKHIFFNNMARPQWDLEKVSADVLTSILQFLYEPEDWAHFLCTSRKLNQKGKSVLRRLYKSSREKFISKEPQPVSTPSLWRLSWTYALIILPQRWPKVFGDVEKIDLVKLLGSLSKQHDGARTMLGLMYLQGYKNHSGEGILQDKYMAKKLFKKSASSGESYGQYRLAKIYQQELKAEKAQSLLKTSADQGHVPAMLELVSYYENQRKPSQTIENILSHAAKRAFPNSLDKIIGSLLHLQSPSSIYLAATLYEKRGKINTALTFLEKAHEKGSQKAFRHVKALAINGHTSYQLLLGKLYVKKGKYEKAHKWFGKLANRRNREGFYQLGNLYREGLGVSKSVGKALDFYEKAMNAEMTSSPKAKPEAKQAIYSLACDPKGTEYARACYLMGQIEERAKKFSEARSWYETAASRKYLPARKEYGLYLLWGKGGAPSLEGAKKYLKNFTKLNFDRKFTGDEDLKNLSILTNLRTLHLECNKIGEAGAKALSPLTNLRKLHLRFNNIGDAGAKALSPLTNLRTLDLYDNNIGDAGAQALSPLTNLRTLHLEFNKIGDAGAQALSPLTNLTTLNLESNKIGEAGAKALSPLTNLRTLYLRFNNIGEEATEYLKKNLPKLKYFEYLG